MNSWPSPETAVYDFGESHPGAAILTQASPVIDIFYLLKMGYADNFTSTYWQPAPARNRQASKFEDGNYYLRTSKPRDASGEEILFFKQK